MASYQGTETYLIECSRENSIINRADDESSNGAWSNETDFVVKRGDKISVEMVCANIRGSGTGAPTIEFSGQNVVVNGETKPYCDTKILLEVFFYMNNNNTYSVGLPLIHPYGGINGIDASANMNMPINLCPRLTPNQVTNQPNHYREINEKIGYISQYGFATATDLSYGILGDAYGISQYKFDNPLFPGQPSDWYSSTVPAGLVIEGIRILVNPAVSPATLGTDFNSVLEGKVGNANQSNFFIGNHVFVDNGEVGSPTYKCWWLGKIEKLQSYLVTTVVYGLQIIFEVQTEAQNLYEASLNPEVACYVGDVELDSTGLFPTYIPLFNLNAGSSQEGLINYDNLNWSNTNVSSDYKLGNNGMFIYSKNTRKPQSGQSAEFNVFPGTDFNPVDISGNSYTSTAGEFGDTPGQAGFRNANIQQENNNQPYIFLRNDHFGVGRMSKNGKTYPLAEPMTAFVYISIEELLQDIDSLSAVINNKLNETIDGFGTTTEQTNQFLLNSLETPDGMNQASNVTPFYNRVGFYDQNVTDNSQNILMKQVSNAQFRNIITDIIPIKNGGGIKVTPANLSPGLDYMALSFGKQYGGVPNSNADGNNPTLDEQIWRAENTYLREILVTTSSTDDVSELVSYNFNDWANPIYGNMATANLYRYQVSDRLARLPLDKCNLIDTSNNIYTIRNIGKCVVLNNLLSYRTLDFIFPNGTNGYTNPNSTTREPKSLPVNDLYENQLIYTNLEFPTGPSQVWKDFADTLRKYETYYNLQKNAPQDYSEQVQDVKNWIWDVDIGQTDDRTTGQLRQTPGQPQNLPPLTSNGTDPLDIHQQNRPMVWDWTAKPPATATDTSSTTFNTALGVTITDYRPVSYNVGRTLICPTTSHEIFAGISMTGNSDEQEKMRFMKDLGRLKLKSRFDKDWYINSRNYLNYNVNSFTPVTPEVLDSGVKDAFDSNVDTTFAAMYDLPIVPYYYTMANGTKKLMCAFQVATSYLANKSKLSTINFGSMCWGNTIGISSSFFDNHAIIPMNNDQVKRSTLLTQTTVGTPGYIQICYQLSNNADTGINYPIIPNQANYYINSPNVLWNADNSGNSNGYQVPPYTDPNNLNRMKFKCTWTKRYDEPSETITAEWLQINNLYEPILGYQEINIDPRLTQFIGLGAGSSPYSFESSPGMCQAGIGVGVLSDNFIVYTDSDGNPVRYDVVQIEIYRNTDISGSSEIVPLNLGLQPNNVNYVWVGSSKPTFQYNSTKGRVEFIQLQEDNILNELTSSGTTNSATSSGQKAAIINSASNDAFYSRNTTNKDYSDPSLTTPVRNQGVRAEISGIGIYNIYLCPENYNPPNNINLSSYWSNTTYSQTETNHQTIIAGCTKADINNWENSLLNRLGFQSHRELLPSYGKQTNRFNPSTFNTTRPDLISRATKPLILCNTLNNSVNPAINTYYTANSATSNTNGLPLYSNGMLNNESVLVDLKSQALTASSPPILSTSPFLLIESDICQTNWRSGRTQQNVLFYLMKNYQASSFIYGYGSSYSHTANQDRVLSLIHTALRDPTTGRLQKCSNNSTIIYKIQRDIVVPPPRTTAKGIPLNIQPTMSTTDQLLTEILQVETGGGRGTGATSTGSSGLGTQIVSLETKNVGGVLPEQRQVQLEDAFQFQDADLPPTTNPEQMDMIEVVTYLVQQSIESVPVSDVNGPDIASKIYQVFKELGGLEGIKKVMKQTDWEDVLTQRVSTLLGPPSSAGLLTYNAQGSETLARLGDLYYSVLTASNNAERQVYGTNIEEIISNAVDTGAIAMRGQFLEDEIQPAKPSIVRGQGVRDEVLVTPEKRGPQTPTDGQPSRRNNTPETKEIKEDVKTPSKYAVRK